MTENACRVIRYNKYMTTRHQIELEFSTSFLLAVFFGVSLAFFMGPKHNMQKILVPVVQSFQNNAPAPTSPPVVVPKPVVTSQISPDGKKLITLTETPNAANATSAFSLVVSDADATSQLQILSETNGKGALAIPFNTWSPDDQYVFLAQTNASGSSALVLRADGNPVAGNANMLDALEIFQSKITTTTYNTTTGWASDNLLVIETKTQDGSEGQSFWLEVPDGAIIPLATRF